VSLGRHAFILNEPEELRGTDFSGIFSPCAHRTEVKTTRYNRFSYARNGL